MFSHKIFSYINMHCLTKTQRTKYFASKCILRLSCLLKFEQKPPGPPPINTCFIHLKASLFPCPLDFGVFEARLWLRLIMLSSLSQFAPGVVLEVFGLHCTALHCTARHYCSPLCAQLVNNYLQSWAKYSTINRPVNATGPKTYKAINKLKGKV
jgi:hypothetical protein